MSRKKPKQNLKIVVILRYWLFATIIFSFAEKITLFPLPPEIF